MLHVTSPKSFRVLGGTVMGSVTPLSLSASLWQERGGVRWNAPSWNCFPWLAGSSPLSSAPALHSLTPVT